MGIPSNGEFLPIIWQSNLFFLSKEFCNPNHFSNDFGNLVYFSPNNPAIWHIFFHYSTGICGFDVWRTLADVNVNNNDRQDIYKPTE